MTDSMDQAGPTFDSWRRRTALSVTIGHVLHCLAHGGAEVLVADMARSPRRPYRFVFLCLDGVDTLGDGRPARRAVAGSQVGGSTSPPARALHAAENARPLRANLRADTERSVICNGSMDRLGTAR